MAVIRGASELKAKLAHIREATGVFLASNELSDILVRRTKARFVSKTGPDGGAWAPNKKPVDSRTKSLLIRSGTLLESIAVIRGSNAGSFATATGAGFRVGIPSGVMSADGRKPVAEYARINQRGVPGRQPARRFLGVGAGEVQEVAARLEVLKRTMGL